MAKDHGHMAWWKRLAPPRALQRPAPALRLPIAILWWSLFLFTVTAQLGGTWRGAIETFAIEEPLIDAALTPIFQADGSMTVHSIETALNEAGFPEEARIIAIGDTPVRPDAPALEVARRFAAASPDTPIRIVSAEGGESHTATFLEKSRAYGREMLGNQLTPTQYFILITSFSLAAALALIVCAGLLRLRRPLDPVALLLSLAFLASANMLDRANVFFWWIGTPWMNQAMDVMSLCLLVAAMPAFPDGVYAPKWSRWILALLPIHILATVFHDRLPEWAPVWLSYGLVGAATVAAALRYRRCAPGLERQQLKWGAAGFAGSLLVLGAFFALYRVSQWEGSGFGELTRVWMSTLSAPGMELAYVLLPIGVLFSLLRYRLWDADAALGRSAAAVALSLIFAAAFAITSELVKGALEAALGRDGQLVATAFSAVVAVLIVGPARLRVNRWVERRFRPERIRLRKLPGMIQLWQHGDSPEALGGRVAEVLAPALHARWAAVVIATPQGVQIAGTAGDHDAAAIADWLAVQGDAMAGARGLRIAPRDPVAPLALALNDGRTAIGAVLIGPRTDESDYSAEQRDALADLEVPLAAGLRHALRDASRHAAIEARLAALEADAARRGAATPLNLASA